MLKALNKYDVFYYDFTDESVLRDFVENQSYELDDIVKYNPYADYDLRDGFKTYYTEDQIWEILKPFYKQLIGKIYIDIDRDYLYELENEKDVNIKKLIKWKILNILDWKDVSFLSIIITPFGAILKLLD